MMIEAYSFLAVFTVQILAMSVLYPAWFIRYWRAQERNIPAERLTEIYADADLTVAQEHFFARYRALNRGIAVLGAVLLGCLYSYMRRPDWDDGPVEALVSIYFLVQTFLPFGLAAWLAARFKKAHQRSLLHGKRKAVLQRRGLFDFVSPTLLFTAALSYFLFAGFVLYIQQHPFPGFAGALVNIGGITLVYAVNALCVYTMLYGKKSNPFETHAGRLHTISATVKSCVYSCIACVVFLSLNFTLAMVDRQRWEPFAVSVFFVIVALVRSMGLTTPRQPAGSVNARPL